MRVFVVINDVNGDVQVFEKIRDAFVYVYDNIFKEYTVDTRISDPYSYIYAK